MLESGDGGHRDRRLSLALELLEGPLAVGWCKILVLGSLDDVLIAARADGLLEVLPAGVGIGSKSAVVLVVPEIFCLPLEDERLFRFGLELAGTLDPLGHFLPEFVQNLPLPLRKHVVGGFMEFSGHVASELIESAFAGYMRYNLQIYLLKKFFVFALSDCNAAAISHGLSSFGRRIGATEMKSFFMLVPLHGSFTCRLASKCNSSKVLRRGTNDLRCYTVRMQELLTSCLILARVSPSIAA